MSPDAAPYVYLNVTNVKLTMNPILWLLAFGAGMTAANAYYAQPLLADIATAFHATSAAAGLVTMATQLGFAAGLVLIVPLADSHDRRRIILGATAGGTLALVAVALAPSLPFLVLASVFLGFLTVTPQLSVAYAATLADDRTRGRAIGRVVSGLLVGILLSRAVSGVLGARIGWRGPFFVAAAATSLLLAVFARYLPSQLPPRKVPYGQLLASLPRLVVELAPLRRHAVLGALVMGAFSVFWTTLTFRLAAPPLHHGSGVAGLLSLLGVAGALAAPLAGRLTDRHGARWVNGDGIAVVALAYAVFAAAGHTLIGLGAGIVLLDSGIQGNHVSNQTRVLSLDAALRNRLNTLYMVSFFTGGAFGSALGAWTWSLWGWAGVTTCGATFGVLGLVAFAFLPDTSPLARGARSERQRP